MSPFAPWPVDITIVGAPRGKGRPRFAKGRTYTDADTARAERTIREEWIAAGRPTLPACPLEACVTAVLARPAAHYTTRGELNAAGKRSPYPTKTPDVDNIWKLLLDALNGVAFPDDRYIVRAHIDKRWALGVCDVTTEPELPHVRIRIRELHQAAA